MELEYDYWTGNFSTVKLSLIRSISQYTRHYDSVKIGITCHPARRKNEHRKGDLKWSKMIVKYETSSVNYINEMEKTLIDYHWEYIDNKAKGGGGPNGNQPYYLYLLLK